jgi:ubiquinone biosynthesis protein UbiJ
MLDELTSGATIALLNRLLARETWARECLAPHAGRGARIDCGPFAVRFDVGPDGTLQAARTDAPAVTIAFDVAALPRALFDPSAVSRGIRLAGDAEFALALSRVLQNLRPEPAEELSRFVGDAAAERIVGLLRAGLARMRDGNARFAETAATYFVSETSMLVARAEADAFARDVAALSDAAERLARRIDALATVSSVSSVNRA